MPQSIETAVRPQSVIDSLKELGVDSPKLYQVSDAVLIEQCGNLVRSFERGSDVAPLAQEGIQLVDAAIGRVTHLQSDVRQKIDEISQTLPEGQRQQFALTVERWLAAKRWSMGGLKGALVARHVIQTEMVSDTGEVEITDALRTLYALPVGEKIQLSWKSRLRQQVHREKTQTILHSADARAAANYLLDPHADESLTSVGGAVVEGESVVLEAAGQSVAIGANGNGHLDEQILVMSTSYGNLPPEPPVDPHMADTQPTRVRPVEQTPSIVAAPDGDSADLKPAADTVLPVEDGMPVTVSGEQPEPSEEEIALRRRQYERDLDKIIYQRGLKEGFREIGRLLLGVISKKWQQTYVENLRMHLFKTLVLEELQKRNRKHMKTDWEKEYEASKRRLKTFEYGGLVAYVELLIDSNMFTLVPEGDPIGFQYSGVRRERK